MLRSFVSLVSEAVNEGVERGDRLFMESFELDLQKSAIYEEYSVDTILKTMFENEGFDVSDEIIEEDTEVDEDKIDALLDAIEKDLDE